MTSQRISVIIPTYNRKVYVQEAINSVLRQTYTDFEIIVVDDGSNDGTGETLRARYGERIRYIWQENQGESAARNSGISIAKGEYVALLDSDDMWLPERLAQQVPKLDDQPEVVLVFSDVCDVNAEGIVIAFPRVRIDEEDLSLESLCLANSIWTAPSTALIRRSAIEQAGGYDESIRYGEDYDFFLRLRLQGSFAYIAEPLAGRRLHAGGQFLCELGPALEQRLASRLKTLHKVFDSWPGTLAQEFRNRAISHCYFFMSMLGYAGNRAALAQQYLLTAMATAPGEWGMGTGASRFVARKLVRMLVDTALANQEPISTTMHKLREGFNYWPQNLPLSRPLKIETTGRALIILALGHSRRTFAYRMGKVLRRSKVIVEP